MTEIDSTPARLADAYFRCWLARDFDSLRSVLADGCTFRGPLARPRTPTPASRGCAG